MKEKITEGESAAGLESKEVFLIPSAQHLLVPSEKENVIPEQATETDEEGLIDWDERSMNKSRDHEKAELSLDMSQVSNDNLNDVSIYSSMSVDESIPPTPMFIRQGRMAFENKTLLTELQQEREKVQTANQMIERLKEENNQMSDAYAIFENKTGDELRELKAKVVSLHAKLNDSASSLTHIENELNKANQKNQELQQENKRLKNEISELRKDLKELQKEGAEITADNDKLKQHVTARQALEVQLKSKTEAQKKVEEEKAALERQLKELKVTMEAKLDELTEQLLREHSEKNDLQQQLDDARQDSHIVDTSMDHFFHPAASSDNPMGFNQLQTPPLSAEIPQLQFFSDQSTKSIQHENEKLDNNNDPEYIQLFQELETFRSTVKMQQDAWQTEHDSKEKLKAELSETKLKRAEMEEENKRLSNDHEKQHQKYEEQQKRLLLISKENEEIKLQLKKSHEEKNKLQKEHKEAKEQQASVQKSSNQQLKDIAQLNQQVVSLQEEKEKLEKENDKLQSQQVVLKTRQNIVLRPWLTAPVLAVGLIIYAIFFIILSVLVLLTVQQAMTDEMRAVKWLLFFQEKLKEIPT